MSFFKLNNTVETFFKASQYFFNVKIQLQPVNIENISLNKEIHLIRTNYLENSAKLVE